MKLYSSLLLGIILLSNSLFSMEKPEEWQNVLTKRQLQNRIKKAKQKAAKQQKQALHDREALNKVISDNTKNSQSISAPSSVSSTESNNPISFFPFEPNEPTSSHQSEKVITTTPPFDVEASYLPAADALGETPKAIAAPAEKVEPIIAVRPEDTPVAGLGIRIGWGDTLYGVNWNVLYQLRDGSFNNPPHADNQHRASKAMRLFLIQKDTASCTELMSLLKAQKYPFEITLRAQEMYNYLHTTQTTLESETKIHIREKTKTFSQDINTKLKSINANFLAQLQDLFKALDMQKKLYNEEIAQHLQKVNKVKQGRLDCIGCNSKSSKLMDGYNSDTDTKAPNQYDEQTFLERKNIECLDTVNAVRNSSVEVESLINKIKTDLSKITFYSLQDK